MKFLVGADVPPDPDSGAAGTVYHTSEALRQLGHDVDEIWRDDLPHRITHGNLHYLLELPFGYRDAVLRKTARQQYDAILLSQPYAWLAARDHRRSGRKGLFLNRSHGLEVMADAAVAEGYRRAGVSEQPFPKNLLTGVLRSALHSYSRLVVKYADLTVVPAEDCQSHLRSRMGAPAKNVVVAPHGVCPAFLDAAPMPMTPERLSRLLYVGQYAFIKAPHAVADIAARVLESEAGATITWVCADEHHSKIRALFPDSLQRRLTMVGWMSQVGLMGIYDSHGVLIFPSYYEGAGKAAIEAMSRGMCVVASRVGGMADMGPDGEACCLCDVHDWQGMAGRAIQVIQSPSDGACMSLSARNRTMHRSWRHCAEIICGAIAERR